MAADRRILLVDDDENVLFVLRAALLRLGPGCEIETAQHGRTALAILADRSFDLLVTDMRLPGADGSTLAEYLRQVGAETQVIWMTAYGCRDLRAEAARLDVHTCLEKPVEIAEFRRAVAAALSEATQ
jgi:DNA-binding NtrC family response regulator